VSTETGEVQRAVACFLFEDALERVQRDRVERGGVAAEAAAGVGLRSSQVVERYLLFVCMKEAVEVLELAAWLQAPIGCECLDDVDRVAEVDVLPAAYDEREAHGAG
jgi:hypothetical protein